MAGYYHLSVSIIGRSAGRSAVACAAYRSGTHLADQRYGKVHDYNPRRRGIWDSGIAVPADAPDWMSDREQLWNAVEAAERRKDAQLSREFVLGFPHQLDQDQRRALLQAFIAEEITNRGLVADWAIHKPNRAGDERNWHAHVMTTMRSTTPDGFEATKDRSLNSSAQLDHWRERWADMQNDAFARYDIRDENGDLLQVDSRSYEKQGLDQEPTVHLGVHATAMERRGKHTELGDINRAVQRHNDHEALEPHPRQAQDMTHQAVANEVEVVPPIRSQSSYERVRSWQPEEREDAYDLEL